MSGFTCESCQHRFECFKTEENGCCEKYEISMLYMAGFSDGVDCATKSLRALADEIEKEKQK